MNDQFSGITIFNYNMGENILMGIPLHNPDALESW